jgi:hypothetical protein
MLTPEKTFGQKNADAPCIRVFINMVAVYVIFFLDCRGIFKLRKSAGIFTCEMQSSKMKDGFPTEGR